MSTCRPAMQKRVMARFLALGSLAAFSLLACAPAAPAAVTIGQTASGNPLSCGGNFDLLQQSVGSGPAYTVPGVGTITSWSSRAGSSSGRAQGVKLFRQISGNTYQAVGHDGPRALTPNGLNTFTTNIPVQKGDILGLFAPTIGDCSFNFNQDPADVVLQSSGNSLADGQQGTFVAPDHRRLNVSATFEPSNTFTLGTLTRDKKHGTATDSATVPNPGTFTVSGNGVTEASASGARPSVSVSGPGAVQFTIRASGKKKRKLKSRGKVKLSPTITYTPTGGTASVQTLSVKLLKKR
jgi:hypothetical protein